MVISTHRARRDAANWKPAKRRQKDTDATWTKRHGKSHFGYKLSINVDKKYKIIRRIETDTASMHDSQHFDNVFDTSNTSRDVYADRGYPSEEREAWLKENGFRNQVQRRSISRRPESRPSDARNGPNRRCPRRFEVKTGRHRREKRRFVIEIEPNSVAVIVGRQDSLKTSRYSRCPIVEKGV